MASHVDLIFGSIFPRVLLPTWTLRTSFGASGLAPNGFFRIFRKPHIGCDFGANLAPFSSPKSTKIHQKIDPKMHQILDRFFNRFFIDVGSILEANLEPCWPHFPPKSRAKRPRHPPKATKTAKSLKNLENNPQKPMGYPSGRRFWSQHGCIWDHLGDDFGPFLDLDLGPILFTFFTILETLLD